MSAPAPGAKNDMMEWVMYDHRELTPSSQGMPILERGRRYSAGDIPVVEQVRYVNLYVDQVKPRDLKIRTVFTPEEIAYMAAADKKIKEEDKKMIRLACAIL